MNRRLWWIAGGIALLVAIVLAVRFWPKPPGLAAQVAAEARAQLNPPRQLDAITRLDSIEAAGDRTIVYQYTLTGGGADVADKLRPGLTQLVCSKPELRQLLAQGLSLEYRYNLPDSAAMPPMTFTAASCPGKG